MDSDDHLKTAVNLSIAGNVIDFGPSNIHDIEFSINEVLNSKKQYFDFPEFERAINGAKTVLVLGDNAGETVFDRILMEQFKCKVYFAVKKASPL